MSAAEDLSDDQRRELDEALTGLRERTGATRTTLRIDFEGFRFPVEFESLAAGAGTIKGDATFDLRRAPSSRHVLETGEMLVQDDCTDHPFAPPPEFIELYGVRAQIICPIVKGDRPVAIISVHSKEGPRQWSEEDRRATLATADAVAKVLG
jgi:maleate isomerase